MHSGDDTKTTISFFTFLTLKTFQFFHHKKHDNHHYREGLDDYINKLKASNPNLQWSAIIAAALASSPIPSKPELAANQDLKHDTALSSCHNSFLSSVSALSSRIKREQALHVAGANNKEVKSLDELRNIAIAKGALLNSLEEKLKAEQKARDECSRFRLLPRICDSLRALFVLNGRTTIISSECFHKLSIELRRNVQDIEKSVIMLACVVPEFVTIFPADDTVPVGTLRINKEAPYGEVRTKVSSAVKLRVNTTLQPTPP